MYGSHKINTGHTVRNMILYSLSKPGVIGKPGNSSTIQMNVSCFVVSRWFTRYQERGAEIKGLAVQTCLYITYLEKKEPPRWSCIEPITRTGPGTRKNDTLWCDVCARGRAVGLEQSSAIKTGHESEGPTIRVREGGGGEKRGPVGALNAFKPPPIPSVIRVYSSRVFVRFFASRFCLRVFREIVYSR